MSEAVYGEIAEVLARPKFARVLTDDRRREILELLSAAALWVEPAVEVRDRRDGKDNRYPESALTAGATAIVSGDADLLALHPRRGIRVPRPAAFLDELGKGRPRRRVSGGLPGERDTARASARRTIARMPTTEPDARPPSNDRVGSPGRRRMTGPRWCAWAGVAPGTAPA